MTQATTKQQGPSTRAVSSMPASSTPHPASRTGVWPVQPAANQTSTQSAASGTKTVSTANELDGIYPDSMIQLGRPPPPARVTARERVSSPSKAQQSASSEQQSTSHSPLNTISPFHSFSPRHPGRRMPTVLSCSLMGISMVVITPSLEIRLFTLFLWAFWIIVGRILLLLRFGHRVRRALVLVLSGGLIIWRRVRWMLLLLRLGG